MRTTTRKLALYLASIPMAATLVVAVAGTVAAHPAPAAPAHLGAPRLGHLHQAGRNSTSSNWSGYATTGGRYTDVKGSWKQPTAKCGAGQTAYAAFWVGIDGDTTGTVEQIGTDADCSRGTPTYYAWYEMYPKFPVNLSHTVRPGDSISAHVSTNGSGSFTLTISDATRGWTFTTHQTSNRAKLGSAEWIAEAPSGSGGVLPLANFGTVSFANCTANGASISANPHPDAITMAANGVTKAVPSGLGSGGTSFSVTWKHS